MERASVSIIIPTKNSKMLLQKHIKDLASISNYAVETIVVDSSDDSETIDFLKQNLSESTTQYFSVPPGLYQAWNTAIKAARADYIYIATSGDRIDLSNFKQLYSTAVKLDADVTVSAPSFVDEQGRFLKKEWPIHTFLKNEKYGKPSLLPASDIARYNIPLFPNTLIGSSASNVYKSSFLRENLFPTDCGMQGDSVWAAMHCYDARWAVEPNCSSYFVVHEKESTKLTYNFDLMKEQLDKVKGYLNAVLDTTNDAESKMILDYFLCIDEKIRIRNQLNAKRKNFLWLLDISAWKLRKKYKNRKKILEGFVA